ncbi:MAG: S41 family peptidase [bacterium]
MENNNKYKIVLLTAILVLVAFISGMYFGKQNTKNSISNDPTVLNSTSTLSNIDMAPFWSVWKKLDEKFVITHKDAKQTTDQDKLWGAIQGLTASYGDAYTVFMPPEDSTAFANDISGNFEGVGMELAIKDGNLVVVSPLKDTPAYNAGVKSGDKIIKIDDKNAIGMPVDSAVKLIRGKAGTIVAITFVRGEKNTPIELKIKRGIINVPTTDTEIKGDVFVIKLYNFYATSQEKFKNALREFAQSGKYKLILDLRGNPGGYLDAAVDMASWFLPLGKVVVQEDFGTKQDEQIYRSKGYYAFSSDGGLKMIILVNEGSASASEILAGALQEHNVAKLVGTKTFGKGSVQELIQITPETSLKVTIAKWLTPTGRSISDDGLTPDYEVKITEADFKAEKDPQMEKAILLLEQ